MKIKEYPFSYCIRKSKSNKSKIKDLEEKLDLLDQSKNKDLSADKTNCERRNLKEKLDSLYERRASEYFIRSRARWVEEGERSTSYFLTLEKCRQASHCINCLKDACGKQHHTDDGILNSAKSYDEQLYTSNAASSEDIDAYFQSLPLENQLDDESKLNCEGPITYEECEKPLSKMKNKIVFFNDTWS